MCRLILKHHALPLAIPVCMAALIGVPLEAQAQQTGRAGDWQSESGQGYWAYTTKRGRSHISVSCDIAATEDHSGTGISIEFDGRNLPKNSIVWFEIDGTTISIPTGATGDVSTFDCEECAQKFYQLWPLLREGRRLEVEAFDGRRKVFSLRGTSKLLPAKPCAAAFPITANTGPVSDAAGLTTPEQDNAPTVAGGLAVPDSPPWITTNTSSSGRLSASSTAADGTTTLFVGCNRLLGPTLGGSIHGYTGNALSRKDDHAEPLILSFVDGSGKSELFQGSVNYFAPDRGWAIRDFPAKMLEPFARGEKLTLLNGAGQVIAEFGLKGSARIRAQMQKSCGF